MASAACSVSESKAELSTHGKSIYKTSAVVFAANIAYLGLGFLANLIVVRALSPQAFGVLSIALALLIILQEVCGGGIDVTMVKFASEHQDRAVSIYRTALQLKIIVNASLAIILWFCAEPIAQLAFRDASVALPLQVAGVGAFGSSLYTFLLARLQAEQRFFAYSVHRVFNNTVKCGLLALLWWMGALQLTQALWVTAGVFLVSSAIGMFWLDRKELLPIRLESAASFRSLLIFGGAVTLSRVLFTLYSRIDLLFLGHYWTKADVAVYSVAGNMAYLIDLCTYSVILTLLPHASRLKGAEDLRQYAKRTLRLCSMFAAVLLPLFLFAPFITPLLFGQRYAEAAGLFRILFAGCIGTLLVHPLYLILYARNRPMMLLFADGVLVITSVVCNLTLTPAWGALGAATGSVIARLCGCIAIVLLLWIELRQPERSHNLKTV